jgi:CubicO group peptidase (beta-lactamase class C family)
MIANIFRMAVSLLLAGLLSVQCVPASADPLVLTPQGARLDQYLARLERLGFSGAVLVASEGKVILHKGYGLADRERRIAYDSGTVFDIGSITKQFTAAAILRLEMAGKLSVEDRISKYCEGVPADKQAITLHHLLTHTSGLRGDFGDDYAVMPRDVMVRTALQSKLDAAPGERYSYSNAGYSLLGAIVELVAQQPYESFLQQQLFAPAGMTKTGYRAPTWRSEELAHGYEIDRDWGTPLDHAWASDGPWWNLRANGGLLSTVGDLYKWHEALLGERILSQSAKAKYFASHVAEDPTGDSYYGYGWVISQTPRNTRLIAHNGGNGIFAADFRRYVDEGAVIIAGSAQADFQSFLVTEGLAQQMFGGQLQPPPEAVTLDAATQARFVGTYVLADGGKVVVAPSIASVNGAPALSIVPDSRAAFEAVMGPVPAEVRARLGKGEARLLSALEQTRQGIFDPLAKVYGVPLDSVKKRVPSQISQHESRLGPFQRFELLGTVVRGQRVATWIRFIYQRGAQLYEHQWEGAEVTRVRAVEGFGGSFLLASGGNELFSFNPRALAVQRIGVELAPGGAAAALTLRGPGSEQRAVRQP